MNKLDYELSKLDLKPSDVIVVYAATDKREMIDIGRNVADHARGNLVVVLGKDDKIENISTEQMARHGWIRANS